MRLEFQEKPYDLLGILILTVLLVIAVALSGEGVIRIALGLIFILFLPGYALIAALFPSGKSIDWIERLALSFGLSIAVTPLIGLVLNYTPWGIRLEPIVASLSLFVIAMCGIAYYRRMKLPVEERLSLSVELGIPNWKEYSWLDKALTIGLVIAIIASMAVMVYAFTVPKTGERFTEFYILDSNGTAGDYPTELGVGEDGDLIIGVVNHEHSSASYTIVIELAEVNFVMNDTTGQEEPIELSRTQIGSLNLTLDHDEMWEAPFSFSVGEVGDYKLELLLFKDGDLSDSYRSLHLWVEVLP
ncbi:MAG: DUF1616 domain-containing protein [Thermoplasmata archaeon]|nr:DUF1616 domain-containing protein [Thermoplasmata archaeon]